jgi:hypothetical protein
MQSQSKALDYLVSQLKRGKTFAHLLAERTDFTRGKVVAMTHSPLDDKELVEFQLGHSYRSHSEGFAISLGTIQGTAMAKPNSNSELVSEIKKFLSVEKRACLLENSLAAAHDPWLRRAKSRILTYNSDVYHVLTSNNVDQDDISVAIKEASNADMLIGALGSIWENLTSSQAFDPGREDLAKFAQEASSVFVSAYDGEGYLVWNSDSQ